ncbi:MAG: hypothetical protein KGJ23_06600 [Euryarchaeota archaeon]|nr:hypothetical protein [Euryarchaeota archaeon]MDE1836269.1 hypothetical protein [Euryarchaeota archaeon]MDE1880897.1 hypothetical protein [Euryarchaeota archaeon]MDE2044335.1 hypothetical protein [Thermoplasmata archaeon]
MSSTIIVGAEGSGRTFFSALLYSSLVRYGGEVGDAFRFHARPESLAALGTLYESVRAGEAPRWPDSANAPLVLDLQFPGHSPRGLLAHLHRDRDAQASSGTALLLERCSTDEVARFVASGGALTSLGQALLEGGALVVLLDGSGLKIDPGTSQPLAHPWDPVLSGLLRALKLAVRDHPGASKGPITPLLVVTKYDLVPDKVRATLLPNGGTMEGWTEESRVVAARELLSRYLPQSRAEWTSGMPAGLQLSPPVAFISWVRPDGGSGPAARLKGHDTPARGWEPDFPYLEYRDLIERLRRLG